MTPEISMYFDGYYRLHGPVASKFNIRKMLFKTVKADIEIPAYRLDLKNFERTRTLASFLVSNFLNNPDDAPELSHENQVAEVLAGVIYDNGHMYTLKRLNDDTASAIAVITDPPLSDTGHLKIEAFAPHIASKI